jgi:hypothetical protein
MSNDLVIGNISTALVSQKPEYNIMLQNINAKMPAVMRDTSNFHKSHSQFMQVTLDITAITPIRSIKHTLAEIDRTRMALQEAYINLRKKQVEIKRKEHQLTETTDPFDQELLEIEIMELQSHMENAQNAVNGALRKVNFLVNQHENLMTCMKQALNAARARGGVIDEGNLIYLFDLGISAAQAQAEVFAYLEMEKKILEAGRAPTHDMTVKWLEACADKWQQDPVNFAANRGFMTFDRTSLTNTPQLEDQSKKTPSSTK